MANPQVGERVSFEFDDCCLRVKGEGVIKEIKHDDEEGNVEGVVLEGVVTIAGGKPTNWWQDKELDRDDWPLVEETKFTAEDWVNLAESGE